jgi:biopolymer transport protein ExbD
MRIRGRGEVLPEISQVSMSDVAFLLLIFFLSTTIFDDEIGLPMVLSRMTASPLAASRAQILAIEIDAAGAVSVDGAPVLVDQIAEIVESRLEVEPELVVAIRTAPGTPYGAMIDALDEIRRTGTQRVSLQEAGG